MMRELIASSISEVLPLISSKSIQIETNESQLSINNLCPTRALFSNNSADNYLWIIKGSLLDIISVDLKDVNNQRLLGSFDFCQIFNDNSIRITNVLQLMDCFESQSIDSKFIYTLIVSLKRNSGGCLLAIIDVRLSLIIKTIECPFKITSLQIISSDRSKQWQLIKQLLFMSGIIAVGTQSGLVFLLDLFLDTETSITEALIPKKLCFIVFNSSQIDINSRRKTALVHNQVVCLPLNSDAHHKHKFIYRADDGEAITSLPKSEVYVSAIDYIPQTAMLCIGFNFGGFQLYNLLTFKLECSCGLEYGLPPVVSFAFQDPENDPKNYSYMWVIRGQEIEDHSNSDLNSSHLYFNAQSTAIMYSLCFENKQWITDYGILYNGFQGCSCRFEYVLGTNPHSPDLNISCNSRLIDCYTIPFGNFSSHKSLDDESVNLDLSLLLISWEALSEGSNCNSCCYFAIFDLNQWYRSQMPIGINISQTNHFSPFLGVFSLEEIANNFTPDAILSVKMNTDSITKFRSQAFQDDLHYYPSSLSFQVTVLSESQICCASYLGLQKRALSQMMIRGHNILIDPKEYINNCITYGLLPFDLSQNPSSTSTQREIILTVALENDCLNFLDQVIQNWSSGELTHIGCDSKFILEWIWKKVSYIKSSIDKITYPLFNYSGQMLDNLNLAQLYAYESDLNSLDILLKKLQTRGAPTTQQGMKELSVRREVTQLISIYLRMLLWLYDCNLLPEHAEDDAYGENEVAFPSSKFNKYYSQRRTELHEINPQVIRKTDLLLIDGMIDFLNPGLSILWKKGGGNGLYPPPNLHSLIGIFLLESVSLVEKHAVMLYSILDLADFLSDRQCDIVEKVKLFPMAFGLMPGLTEMVQGFWGLDHKQFDFALRYLLDPIVKPLLLGKNDKNMIVFNNLQQRIVTSFLYQNEDKSALLYSQNCGQFSLDTAVREKLHLNILLINQQIYKALHYVRLCRNETNARDLLYHMFEFCEQLGVIEDIFKIPLNELEEQILTDFLISSDSERSKQILVLYLILNNKITDAFNVVNKFENDLINNTNSELSQKSEQLIDLVKAYETALPKSITNIAKGIAAIDEKKSTEKPKITMADAIPIKVKPKSVSYEWNAPSKTIEDVMQQIEEIWSKEETSPIKTSTPAASHRKSISSKVLLSQNSPFLRTPVINSRSLKKSKQLSNAVYPTPKLIDFETNDGVNQKIRSNLSSVKQSKKINFHSELLSILETPQIKRKSPSNRTKSIIDVSSLSSNYFTPTSILKVKQMMRKSKSPSSLTLSPVSTVKLSSNKALQSTPLQHKLRFSEPEKEISFPISEESVENVRLTSIKDTFVLKQKSISKPLIEDFIEMEESDLIDLSTIRQVVDETPNISLSNSYTSQHFVQHHKSETIQMNPNFVFSPPKTRSSTKKQQKSVKMDKSVVTKEKFLFSPPVDKAKNESEEDLEKVPEQIEETIQVMTIENRETPSRSSTPVSYIDESDSHKSDTSQRSKVSSHSSRSSRTPTKKGTKKVTETPTHTMKLRASTTKTKTSDTPKKSDKTKN